LIALAKAQVRLGDYEGAVRNAERARRLHPMAPEYYAYVYGQAIYAQGNYDKAENVIRECLVRAPQDSNCLLIQVALLVGRDQLEQAQMAMSSLIKARPDFSSEKEREYRRFGHTPHGEVSGGPCTHQGS